MSSYAKRVNRSYPFPQADSSGRILDTLELVCRGPIDDQGVAESFGISARQGAYYANGAAFLGLLRNSGCLWRATPEGTRINALEDDSERRRAVGSMVIALPVFDRAAEHLALLEEMPPVEEIIEWIRAGEPDLNDITASRRANTVHSWVATVAEDTPELIAAIASGDSRERSTGSIALAA